MADGRADGESEMESSTASSRKQSVTGPSKVILLGTSGVGKSTLFLRIRDGKFHDNIGGQTLDFLDKNITLNNNKSVLMRLYDTAGMESWHEKTITRSYYLGSRVVLIVYSADDMDSVDSLVEYMEDVNRHAPSAKKFLIRNKIDLEDQTVKEQEVEAKLTKAGYFFEKKWLHRVSAFKGDGIQDLIKEIGNVLVKQAKSTAHNETRTISSLRRDNNTAIKQKSSCC